MSEQIEFRLNGETVRVTGVSPNVTLLEYLRASGRTGSKEGCAEGDCGACSVAIVERDSEGRPAFRAINSCLVPLPAMAGREIVTVEGIGGETPHPVQAAMTANLGSQCGYCTPGFVASLFEGYYRKDIGTKDQLDDQLCGNLCRCTGYRAIRDAAVEAFACRENPDDPFREILGRRESGALGAAQYAWNHETFRRPVSLGELFGILRESPDARLVAGATELGLEITKRFRRFPILVSVEAIPELREISATEREWRIGAAATLTAIGEKVAPEYPALAAMLRLFGSRQIRNRATMGGNLVTASPIGDSAPVLLALGASVIVASEHRERQLPLDEFFVSYRKTALLPGEILKTILIPRGTGKRICRFYKVSKRREMDISTVAGCFAIDRDAAGIVTRARLCYGGVAPTSVRARNAEAALEGRPWDEAALERARELLRSEFTPISDTRGSAGYRQGLIAALFEKFFREWEEPAEADPALPAPAAHPVRPEPHESGHKHVNGAALYADDEALRRKMLEVWPVCAPHARARIKRRDATEARRMPGIEAVLLAEDVPGVNDVGAVRHDEILLADTDVWYHGQIIALVVGATQEQCRAAAEKVAVDYEPLPALLTIADAIAADSFHTEPNYIRRGDAETALESAPFTIEGEFSFGGQDHFYLESHAAWAEPGEDGSVYVSSSTQHPSEVQHIVAHVLGVPMTHVVVESPRMGGGFGGKETQAATFAALAALAAARLGKSVRVRLNRDQDMMITGKRHPFLAKYRVGFDGSGLLTAAKIDLFSDGGWSLDLSVPVTDRAVFHLDNAYYIPNADFSGRVAKTALASNTAFRGFGGPQGMLVIEEIIDRIARGLGLPPEEVREKNFYRGAGETNTTHYGEEVENNQIANIWNDLKTSSEFDARRREITEWNAAQPNRKRGLAITPVKFGISFTLTHLNQAGALVLIYQDGTLQVNHGATEMGQGVHTNMKAIAAREFGLSMDRVRVMNTRTDKVPNTSATAASCGTDLNGAAVREACATIRTRLIPVAAEVLTRAAGRTIAPDEAEFGGNRVFVRGKPEIGVPFSELVTRAYIERISLSSTGYYKTPSIHYDRVAGRGKPFLYYAVGAAVSEVEVDGFTGMMRTLRVDILHDAGNSINEGINRGQIEGGFVQGAGWLTCEELVWDRDGKLLTHSPDTYKIPAIGDVPVDFRVTFFSGPRGPSAIYGSKAVGEPPLMLAISVREAIRDAVAAFGAPGGEVPLRSPATGEAIYEAIRARMGLVDGVVSERQADDQVNGVPEEARL